MNILDNFNLANIFARRFVLLMFMTLKYRYSDVYFALFWHLVKLRQWMLFEKLLFAALFHSQFFQWADQPSRGGSECTYDSSVAKISLRDAAGYNTFMRGHQILFYCESQFLRKTRETKFKKGIPVSKIFKLKLGMKWYEHCHFGLIVLKDIWRDPSNYTR